MKRFLALVVLAAVLAAGCGADGKPGTTPSQAPPAGDLFDKAPKGKKTGPGAS